MIQPAQRVNQVRYEIRGPLARRAHELEQAGHDILQLNVGNPGRFGLHAPDTMRQAIINKLPESDAYGPQCGILPAREAVANQFQERGLPDTRYHHVIIGNGVSELVDLSLRALLEPGDEVLIPAPDYPLWTAATVLNGGRAVHYPCCAEQGFIPDISALETRIGERTRAIVIINPNNPTGAVYPQALLRQIAELAERHGLVLYADEIYDAVTYDEAVFTPMATLATDAVCVSFGGLSKVWRACGWRVGWRVFSGDLDRSADYLAAVEKLAALRLSSNVPGQWAVQSALGGFQTIHELTAPAGRLHESRRVALESVSSSRHLQLVRPDGAMYAFPAVQCPLEYGFDDHAFAARLLEQAHILIVPGSGFNISDTRHFRITLLPEPHQLQQAIAAIDALLDDVLEQH